MPIIEEGSVRVDLAGGTLDIHPINLIIPGAMTLNMATSLKARVVLESRADDKVEIISKDYNSSFLCSLSELSAKARKEKNFQLLLQIIDFFSPNHGLSITTESGSPPGAGLGGSSAMGVTVFKALAKLFKKSFQENECLRAVQNIEARVLDSGPTGYQDYYPALYGGLLALKPGVDGVIVEQLYTKEHHQFFSDHTTLVFTGVHRNSGINNWEVIKLFFDKDKKTRNGLQNIANCTQSAYEALKTNSGTKALEQILKEGEIRAKLFPGIIPAEVRKVLEELRQNKLLLGSKICGAGGGGCLLLLHEKAQKSDIHAFFQGHSWKNLDYSLSSPL